MIYKAFVFSDNEVEQLKAADPTMKKLIALIGKIERHYTPDLFGALISSIVSQQLSNKAAEAIWNKFEAAVPGLAPESVLGLSQERLREIGLSNSKINYIKNIAEEVASGRLVLEDLNHRQDEEITAQLLAIKGIGPWTVEMFLIFALGRRDVMSYGDLGIRKGISWLYQIPGILSKPDFDRIAARISPNGTLASLYLWEIGDQGLYRYNNVFEAITGK